MVIFQELNFATLLAIVLSFAFAKLVSFAVSNPCKSDSYVLRSVSGSLIAKEEPFNGGFRVKSSQCKNSVEFVDDFEVKGVDRCETRNVYENIASTDKDDNQFEDKTLPCDSEMGTLKKESFNAGEVNGGVALDKTSEMLIQKNYEGNKTDGYLGEKNKASVARGNESLIVEDFIIAQEEGNDIMGSGENEGALVGKVEEDGSDEDDDWEGVERSELERVFAEAVNFVELGSKGKVKDNDWLLKLDSDVKLQLYGLQKVALEGPCHGAQPMALMLSSRAKWNSWHKVGSMSREEAMEKYAQILSDCIPTWRREHPADDDTQGSSKFATRSDAGSEWTREFKLNGAVDCSYVQDPPSHG